MSSFVSPGVYVIEKDISDYSPALNSSVVGLVGFAQKGPVDKATLITSQESLVKTFGKPHEGIPGQALLGALEVLETTNALYFVRATTTSALDASAQVQLGSCPAVLVSSNGFGVSSHLYLGVQVWDNKGVAQFSSPKEISILSGVVATASGGHQGMAMANYVGGTLDQDKIGAFWNADNTASGWLVANFAGSGAKMSVSAFTDNTFSQLQDGHHFTPLGVDGEVSSAPSTSAGTSSLTVWGTSFMTSDVSYLMESINPGGGYNIGTKEDGTTSGVSVEIAPLGWQNTLLQINEDGALEENYKVSLIASGAFVENVINTGEIDPVSDILKGNIVSGNTLANIDVTTIKNFTDNLSVLAPWAVHGRNGATGSQNNQIVDPKFVKFVQGTYGLSGGVDGFSADGATNATAIIGDPTSNPKTGIYALDDDSLNISIAATPGITNQSVQNALITLAEESQNFIALVAPPYSAIDNVQDAIDWINGKTVDRTSPLNSSYGAIYWPWVKVFSLFDEKDVWYDPTIFAARQMAFTDEVADPWFAPAGVVRGRLTKPVDTEMPLTRGDLDSLYSGGNVVNPIVKFAQQGIMIWGQRTAQRTPTALDRVNVRRMMIVLRKLILASTRRFVFEPNDVFTWERIEDVVNPLLDDIRRRRGITEFRVVCDETTNTPIRIDRNELWTKVLIKPTKTAEILVFELNLTNQSAKLGG